MKGQGKSAGVQLKCCNYNFLLDSYHLITVVFPRARGDDPYWF